MPRNQPVILRLTQRALKHAENAPLIYRQLSSLYGEDTPQMQEASLQAIALEGRAIGGIAQEAQRILNSPEINQEPKYARKGLLYLSEQLEIFFRNLTIDPQAPPQQSWLDSNLTLRSQLQALLRDVEQAESILR